MYYFREHVTFNFFFSLSKCWRMLLSTVNLCTLENSTIQKLSVIIILFCVLLATIANPQEG